MPLTRKALALSLGLLGVASAATIAQPPRGATGRRRDPRGRGRDRRLAPEVRRLGAPRRGDRPDGAADRQGGRQEAGDIIGYLHKEVADLSVAEARIQAESQGAIQEGQGPGRAGRPSSSSGQDA